MKIEQFVHSLSGKPSFFVRIWLFIFLLINRNEGKELIMDLSAKTDRLMERAEALHKKANLLLENTSCEILAGR